MPIVTEAGVRIEVQEAYFRTIIDDDPPIEHLYTGASGVLVVFVFGGLSGPAETLLPSVATANRAYRTWQANAARSFVIPNVPFPQLDIGWDARSDRLLLTMRVQQQQLARYRLRPNGTVDFAAHDGGTITWTEGVEWAQWIQRFLEEAQARL